MKAMTRADAVRGLLSAVLAVALLAAIEIGVRVAGPDASSRLPYQRLSLPVLERQDDAWATTDPRMAAQRLPDAAAPRIVVVGGSAAAGLGYGPNASISAHLQRILRRQQPDAAVLNLSLVAAGAREVGRIAADAVSLAHPDVIVVYSGNNEFLEPLALRVAWSRAGALDRARLLAAGSRTHGLLRELFAPVAPAAPPRGPGATLDGDVALSEAEERAVLSAYEDRLRGIATLPGVEVVLATVATNSGWQGATHRRASPAHADIVRRVAADSGASLADVAAAPDIDGFDSFYDHIHFTPYGAARAAVVVAAALGVDPGGYADTWRQLPDRDAYAVDAWLGFDPAHPRDRDLWKYDRLIDELDRRIAADPTDFDALVYRGNAWWFTLGGGKQARGCWRRALELRDDPEVRANLALR